MNFYQGTRRKQDKNQASVAPTADTNVYEGSRTGNFEAVKTIFIGRLHCEDVQIYRVAADEVADLHSSSNAPT